MKLNFKLYSTNFSAPIKKRWWIFDPTHKVKNGFVHMGTIPLFLLLAFRKLLLAVGPPSPSLVHLRAHFARHVQCVLSGVLSSTLHMLEKCHFVYNAHISISHVFMHIFVVQKLQINPERESGTDDTYTVYRLYSIHIDSIDNRWEIPEYRLTMIHMKQ